MQKILILYTGGTIGMEKADDGTYHPTSGFKSLAAKTIAPAIWAQMPDHDYLEISPAIDSADISPAHWSLIAQTLIDNYDNYGGFIVLHGTDTMAYTASMLSFLLGGLDKSVIFTGSQIPLTEPCSDGANNLLVALQLAQHAHVPEVCIYFANQLFRGNRASKISTSAMIAFESTNYPTLATFENRLKLFKYNWLSPQTPCFDLPALNAGLVAVIYLTPGMPVGMMQAAINAGVKGVVLVSYGAGNVPVSNADLLQGLKNANDHGIVMVNVSQCAGGHVSGSYAASKPLHEAGVISGEDMTVEAAVTKLHYLLAKYADKFGDKDSCCTDVVKQQLAKPLRGELSIF